MNISTVKSKLRKGHTGKFRLVKPGETIEKHDIVVNDLLYDTLMRLEFDK